MKQPQFLGAVLVGVAVELVGCGGASPSDTDRGNGSGPTANTIADRPAEKPRIEPQSSPDSLARAIVEAVNRKDVESLERFTLPEERVEMRREIYDALQPLPAPPKDSEYRVEFWEGSGLKLATVPLAERVRLCMVWDKGKWWWIKDVAYYKPLSEPVYEVEGRITSPTGVPLANLSVFAAPSEFRPPPVCIPCETDAEGRFRLTARKRTNGLPAGKYVLLVSDWEEDVLAGKATPRIHPRYQRSSTSDLEMTVTEGTNAFDFVLEPPDG